MKSGNLNFLEPSGPPQACNGTALPFTKGTNYKAFKNILNTTSLAKNKIGYNLFCFGAKLGLSHSMRRVSCKFVQVESSPADKDAAK